MLRKLNGLDQVQPKNGMGMGMGMGMGIDGTPKKFPPRGGEKEIILGINGKHDYKLKS